MTGGSRGIGAAIALRRARLGYGVCVNYRASVGAFSRLWLGARSATCRSWTDELSASPDLPAKLDDVLRLPCPASDWDY